MTAPCVHTLRSLLWLTEMSARELHSLGSSMPSLPRSRRAVTGSVGLAPQPARQPPGRAAAGAGLRAGEPTLRTPPSMGTGMPRASASAQLERERARLSRELNKLSSDLRDDASTSAAGQLPGESVAEQALGGSSFSSRLRALRSSVDQTRGSVYPPSPAARASVSSVPCTPLE